jgi:hypothetical protein
VADDSNIGVVVKRVEDFVDSFDFQRPGRAQSLGRDIAHKIAECIHERVDRHVDPSGSPWQPNSTKEPPRGGYRGWKERKYDLVDEPNIRTGQMTSQLSLFGNPRINRHDMEMVYGLEEPPERSAAPTGYMSEQDKKITDTEKAYFAHTGQSVKRIKRKFYQATREDALKVIELAQEALSDYIRSISHGP